MAKKIPVKVTITFFSGDDSENRKLTAKILGEIIVARQRKEQKQAS